MTSDPSYDDLLTALGICIAGRVPVLLWGNPGEGKTALIETAADLGWHVETVILSQSEPSDLAGLPVVGATGSVTLAPPAWARRLAESNGPALCFFDELSTASPALQAAALRVLTHHEVGNLALPGTVTFVAAANPIDVAAGGWDLAAPTASRFVHLEFGLPLDVFADGSLTGEWPSLPVPEPPVQADLAVYTTVEMAKIVGYLKARASQLSSIPRDATDRGRAFPTPRTWSYAGRLLAIAELSGAGPAAQRLLVAGCVGDAAAHEFFTWVDNVDLPDPESLLAPGATPDFTAIRPDRIVVVLQGLVGAVRRDPSPPRWRQAVEACVVAAEEVGPDPAVPAIRALLDPRCRPVGAKVPAGIAVFGPALRLAGVLP